MSTLLFKKTTNLDLEINQKVAYKDKAGEYTLTAKIDNISTDKDGIFLYQIDSIYYMANELKLIKEDTKVCNIGDEMKEKGFVEVTKDKFFDTLCAEQKNVITTTIEGGGKGNFYPLIDIWYYTPNQSNVFGKSIEHEYTKKHLDKYFLTSK